MAQPLIDPDQPWDWQPKQDQEQQTASDSGISPEVRVDLLAWNQYFANRRHMEQQGVVPTEQIEQGLRDIRDVHLFFRAPVNAAESVQVRQALENHLHRTEVEILQEGPVQVRKGLEMDLLHAQADAARPWRSLWFHAERTAKAAKPNESTQPGVLQRIWTAVKQKWHSLTGGAKEAYGAPQYQPQWHIPADLELAGRIENAVQMDQKLYELNEQVLATKFAIESTYAVARGLRDCDGVMAPRVTDAQLDRSSTEIGDASAHREKVLGALPRFGAARHIDPRQIATAIAHGEMVLGHQVSDPQHFEHAYNVLRAEAVQTKAAQAQLDVWVQAPAKFRALMTDHRYTLQEYGANSTAFKAADQQITHFIDDLIKRDPSLADLKQHSTDAGMICAKLEGLAASTAPKEAMMRQRLHYLEAPMEMLQKAEAALVYYQVLQADQARYDSRHHEQEQQPSQEPPQGQETFRNSACAILPGGSKGQQRDDDDRNDR